MSVAVYQIIGVAPMEFTGPALHLRETWAGAVFGVAFGDFAALTRWIVLSENGGEEENDGAEALVSKLLFQARLTSDEMMQGERPLFESYDTRTQALGTVRPQWCDVPKY
jgi:hypothetical protein